MYVPEHRDMQCNDEKETEAVLVKSMLLSCTNDFLKYVPLFGITPFQVS